MLVLTYPDLSVKTICIAGMFLCSLLYFDDKFDFEGRAFWNGFVSGFMFLLTFLLFCTVFS